MPTREQLASLVEEPILGACKILWDKNIVTGMSSANRKDVGRVAYIDIPVRFLSRDNYEIVETIPSIENANSHGSENEEVKKISYSVTESTTVQEVSQYFEQVANTLQAQDIMFGINPINQARNLYKDLTLEETPEDMSDIQIAETLGYIVQDGVIYESELVYQRHLNFLNQTEYIENKTL